MKNDIVINPKIRFGKPIIRGTRMTVDEVLGALASGMEYDEICSEYGLTKAQILAALHHVRGWVKGEEAGAYALPVRR